MKQRTSENQLARQANIFARYLTGERATNDIRRRFIAACRQLPEASEQDTKLLIFIERHPASLGLIDAGLPFYRRYSEVRRRLYLMLAILEASPDYADLFLPRKRNPLYVLIVIGSGVRAIIKTIVGSVLVRVVG